MPTVTNTTIASLTEIGCRLGQRLANALDAEHLHKPQPFGDTLRNAYLSGRRLIFITATGIAVRTLAPVLQGKLHDPPVLVLDQRGRFVIPLVSGHEGGANEWSRQVAELLGAHCVITSAHSYAQPVYVAGIGCERGCPAAVIAELVDVALRSNPIVAGVEAITMAASIDVKAREQGLLIWAESLREPVRFYPAEHLLRYSERLTEKSRHVFDVVGCYGVAEAAALAGAEALSGGEAELVIEKHKNSRATFALARAYWVSD